MGVIGEPLSEEIKLKISQSLKGRTISVEHRKKISETKKKQGIRPYVYFVGLEVVMVIR